MLHNRSEKEHSLFGKGWGRRWISLALCLIMSFSLLPVTALASQTVVLGEPTFVGSYTKREYEEAIEDMEDEAYDFSRDGKDDRLSLIKKAAGGNSKGKIYVLVDPENCTDLETAVLDYYHENYAKFGKNPTFYDGTGTLLYYDFGSIIKDMCYLPLEHEYLDYYYQCVLDKWWASLSAVEKDNMITAWANEAKAQGVTIADRETTGAVQVTIPGETLNNCAAITDKLQGTYTFPDLPFNIPSEYLTFYWITVGGAVNPDYNEYMVKDTYLLRVDTGILSGKNVLYLGIRFKDPNGIEHTEFILPHDGSLQDSFRLAKQYGDVTARENAVYSSTGYSINSDYSQRDGLSAYTMDTYLFQPGYEIKEVVGLDVFMRYSDQNTGSGGASMGGNKNGWTCNGIYLYQVDELYGMDMAGYYSDTYYISFKGELLAKMNNEIEEFELDRSDTLFRLGRDDKLGIDFQMDLHEPYDSHSDRYIFKFDFADVAGGGIEALAAYYGANHRLREPVEAMTLAVAYEDHYGEKRNVYLPVVTSSIAWAVENGYLDSELHVAGVAQQGQSLVFPGTLPDFEKLTSMAIVFGYGLMQQTAADGTVTTIYSGAAAVANIKCSDGSTRRMRNTELSRETCALTGMQIYGAGTNITAAMEGALLTTDVVGGDPLYVMLASNADGLLVQQDENNITGRLSTYKKGDKIYPDADSSKFLVIIETDTMSRAATTGDISLNLSYVSTDGTTKVTDAMSLKEKAQEFYGYWPGNVGFYDGVGLDGDVSYLVSVSAGGQLAFQLDLDDVNTFTGATLTLKGDDDWQMASLKILYVDSVGKRVVTWEDIGFSDRRVTRGYDINADVLAMYPNALDATSDTTAVYLGGSITSKTITFGAGSKSVVEKEKHVDWSKIRYSMTYKEARQDLGFTASDSTYLVSVKVASNTESNLDDGDCGSNNLFYFKLIFESGSSGYVLANQQLTSDGFRADRLETFYVTCNEDYGALTAVSIIPEDDSGSDNQDAFDKLNISYINVTKLSDDGMSKTWKVGNVGWINVDYRDKSMENDSNGRPGRSEAQMARTFAVSSQGYSVNLLFTMTTGSYERGASDVNRSETNTTNPQLAGSVIATIEYYDNSGMLHKESVDVVRAMYNYAQRTPQLYNEDTTTYRTEDGLVETRAKSDPSFMFRGNHVDRFMVTLTDVRQITRVRFGVSSEYSTTWKLDNVTISQVKSQGTLQLSDEDEYRWTNEYEELCRSNDELGYVLKVFAPQNARETLGEEQSLSVDFTPHSLDISTSGSEWTSTITKEPANINDTLNFYVYMTDDPKETPVSKYNLKGNIEWHSASGDKEWATAVSDFATSPVENSEGKKVQMFYKMGIKVSGMDALRRIYLQGVSPELLNAHADYVIIQHVRSGVTIATYRINMHEKNLEYLQEGRLDEETGGKVSASNRQVVKLFFSPDMTESSNIYADSSDLAVAIRYRTSNDMVGDSGPSSYYNSAYVFLSELRNSDGSLKYPAITPGMVAEIEFNEPYVESIVGVTLAATGKTKATLQSACVGVYDNLTGANVGWYSFNGSRVLSTTPYTASVTSGNVTPVRVTFRTGEAARVISSGGDNGASAPIRMTITYINSVTNQKDDYVIEDIRKFLTDGDFNNTPEGGDSATIQFFMSNVGSIRSITLEPRTSDQSSIAQWGLKEIYCEAEIEGDKRTMGAAYESARMIVEDEPLSINMTDVVARVSVRADDPRTGQMITGASGTNGIVEITVPYNCNRFILTPNITGSLDGYSFDFTATYNRVLAGDTSVRVRPYESFALDGGNLTFGIASNELDASDASVTDFQWSHKEDTVTYTIVITSQEQPDVKVTAIIHQTAKEYTAADEAARAAALDPAPAEDPTEETPEEPGPEETPEEPGPEETPEEPGPETGE